MNDYLSNPKCDEWNNPHSIYRVDVIYKWTHKPSGTTGLTHIRVKSESYAVNLIEYWNSSICGDLYQYEIISGV